jgi:hypothetical protein
LQTEVLPVQIRLRVRSDDLATPYFDYLFVSIDELLVLLSGTEWMLEEYQQDGPSYGVVLSKRKG